MITRELVAWIVVFLTGVAFVDLWQTQPNKLMAAGLSLILLSLSYLTYVHVLDE